LQEEISTEQPLTPPIPQVAEILNNTTQESSLEDSPSRVANSIEPENPDISPLAELAPTQAPSSDPKNNDGLPILVIINRIS
jgi:hypothetical protein